MPSLFCRCEEDWSWPDLMGTETVWRKGEHKNLINTMFNYQVSPHVNSATHVHMISIHQTSSMIITIQNWRLSKFKRTYMQDFFFVLYIIQGKTQGQCPTSPMHKQDKWQHCNNAILLKFNCGHQCWNQCKNNWLLVTCGKRSTPVA